tara:strand:+ start:322 stop:513 length:192 start_codon:yes stop_codon:yes gene_type:complete
LHKEGGLADMIISPHGGFTAGNGLTCGNVVPAIGAVVDRVKEQALVLGIGGEVGFIEEGPQHG